MSSTPPSARAGVLFAAGAFFVWGAVPLYFRALGSVPPLEIIAYRVLWSTVFLVGLLLVSRGPGPLLAVLRRPRLLAGLTASAALVTCNWLTFVYAVNAGRVLDTSLGYYITPQVNVLLGLIFLRERLRPPQWLAVLLAFFGVVNQIVQLGSLPWVSLVLALSFGGYGLLRKQIPVDPVTGLLVETLIVTPLAIAYLWWKHHHGGIQFGHGSRLTDVLLAFLGVTTAVPLMLFAAGARRLRLTTVGFIQYLAPTMTLMLAVFVFGEPFGLRQALTFVLIWAGIAVYVFDARRRSTQPVAPAPG